MKDIINQDIVDRLYSKTRYAKDFGLTRRTLDRRIEAGEVKAINIKGTTIVVADPAK